VRRRLVNILCVLSLLVGVAAILRRVSISQDELKSANASMFGRQWGITCDTDEVMADVDCPPDGAHRPFLGILEPGIHQFAGFTFADLQGTQDSEYQFRMPWWAAIAIPLLLPVIVGFRRHVHRTKIGRCPKCRYNLMGNTSGICPECGTKIPAEPLPNVTIV